MRRALKNNDKFMSSRNLEKKLKFLIRWIFSDILICLRSTNEIWKKNNLHTVNVYKYSFEINEANIGAIQLICVGIETFGRIFLGKKDEKDVSKKCFTEFIKEFFPKKYFALADEIYKRYRCILLHGHVIAYKNSIYPNRYRRDEKAEHLAYANNLLNDFAEKPDSAHQRLVIDVDVFYADFKNAVEIFCEKVIKSQLLLNNIEKSLEDIPEDI